MTPTTCFICRSEFKDDNDIHKEMTHRTKEKVYWVMICTRCYEQKNNIKGRKKITI